VRTAPQSGKDSLMKSTQRSRFLVFLTTLLGISLLTLIQSSAFSQSVSGSNERPVPIDVVLQNDSPARIKLLGTNTLSILTESNTYESQTIEFEIQNVSRKKIRTCVFLLASTSQISSPGSYSFTKFEPGSVIKTGRKTLFVH
jgi:hypothetical protein